MPPRFARWKPIRSPLVVQLLGLVWAASLQADPTVSLVAVKKNNAAISPTSNVTNALPGDIFECEIYASDFQEFLDAPVGYYVSVAGRAGVESSGCGKRFILPIGWDAPLDPSQCQTDSDCLDSPYNSCYPNTGPGICVAADHHPELGAFVTRTRDDFLLVGYTLIGGVATTTLNYEYGYRCFECDGGIEFSNAVYLGTLKLGVKSGAVGTFTFGFVEGGNYIIGLAPDEMVWLQGVPLTIQVGECPIRIVGTDPPPCTIDARYPNDPVNVSQRFGFDQITLTFSRDPGPLTPADFVCASFLPLPCVSHIDQSGAQVKLTLNHVIASDKWTCIQYLGDQDDLACIGALGADTDANKLSDTPDTLALIDTLEGNHTLHLWQTDLDRSGTFTPLDILASIDLLNGAGALNAFKGLSLTACPTTGIPTP